MVNYIFQKIKWVLINIKKIKKFHRLEKSFMDWHLKQDIKKLNPL